MERAEKIGIAIAILLLSMSLVSAIYLKEREEKTEKIVAEGYIIVNGENISLDEIFKKCSIIEIEAMGENYSGVSLSCVINLSNVENPQEHEYTIVGADGYAKTVSWDDMKKGILTKERKTIFPHLRKAFWVKDVIKIEVV